ILADRCLKDNMPDALSVSVHVKCLTLGGSIQKKDMRHLKTIVPRLVHLNCLYWKLGFMPKNLNCFSRCSELHSVHLWPKSISTSSKGQDWIERLPQLLRFTNLTHFSLKSPGISHKFNFSQLEPLAPLLQSSPNLEFIVLDLQDTNRSGQTYSPTVLLEPLGDQFVLPRLHTLHMLGSADPGWVGFASNPTHPFRAFLARHPSIRDLAVGCPLDTDDIGMDPDDLAHLLPSVKHLALPSFMCEPAIESQLALQLESLAISDPLFHDEDALDPVAEAMGISTLPNLRKLAIWAEPGDFELRAGVVEALTLAAKGLEELEFRAPVEDYSEFIEAMSGAENLRQIKLVPSQVMKFGLPFSWRAVLEDLAEMCPRLEIVVGHSGIDGCQILRNDDGEVYFEEVVLD
ncbi:unnamed protein product, partial [Rhizoctonia solani]